MERILDNSSSDDTISIISSTSTTTDKGLMIPDERRRTLGGGNCRPLSAPMHRPLARTASDSSRFAHPRRNSGDDTYLSSDTVSESGSDKLRIVRTRSPGSSLFVAQSAARPESPNSPESNLTRTGSEKAVLRVHKPLRSTKSLPADKPVSVVVENVTEIGLSNITEGKEMSPMVRRSVERESSPGLLERPVSSQRLGNSPGVSPSGSPRLSSRKKRLASKRGAKKALGLPETGE